MYGTRRSSGRNNDGNERGGTTNGNEPSPAQPDQRVNRNIATANRPLQRGTHLVPISNMFRTKQRRLQNTSDVTSAVNDSEHGPAPPEIMPAAPSTPPPALHVRPPPRRDLCSAPQSEGNAARNVGLNPARPQPISSASRINNQNEGIQGNPIERASTRERLFTFQPTRSRQPASVPGVRNADLNPVETTQRNNQMTPGDCIAELREELSSLKEKFNEKKTMLKKALTDIATHEMNNKAMVTMFNRLEQERDELKLENISLKRLNAAIPRRKAPKTKYSSDLPLMFQGIATSISKNILRWCDRETKELEVMGDALQRNWHRRSEKAIGDGIKITDSDVIVPTSPSKVADCRQYYTPSFQNEKELLMMMIDEEMASTMWYSHFPTEQHKDDCRKIICDDSQLKAQLKQTLSDRMSARKRNARDKLFQFLGYFLVLSRKSKSANEQEESERMLQKEEIHEKFVVKEVIVGDDIFYDFSTWRTQELSKLACSTHNLSNSVEVIAGDVLFKHNLALHVLHEFRGHTVENNPDLLSSIMTLARLDSWIMTSAECMNMEDGRGGQRQKAFNELYNKFLPMATRQLVEKICYTVWKENSEELLIRCSVEDRGENHFDNDKRIATKVMESKSDKCFYISVRPDWFIPNVTKYLGNVCDCYIGEGKRDGKLFHLYGMEAQESTEYAADTEEAREVPDSSNTHFARFRV